MTSHGEHPDHVAVKASDVRFFWIEGEGIREDRLCHWCVDCAFVAVAVWHGGRLVSSEAPPPGGRDTAWVRETLEKDLVGPAWHLGDVGSPTDEATQEWCLCPVCRLHLPRPVAAPRPADEEPCRKCLCSREDHVDGESFFFMSCATAWPDAVYYETGELIDFDLVPCPCDGYEPPAGGRPITWSEVRAGVWVPL